MEKRSVLPSLTPSIADQTQRWRNAGSGTVCTCLKMLNAAGDKSDARALFCERST